MKNILIITVIIICSCISVAHAELSNEKRVEIEKMLRLTGMEKLMVRWKSQIISAWEKKSLMLPKYFGPSLSKKWTFNELIEKLMPIYDKYYTLEDLKAVNAFTKSRRTKAISCCPYGQCRMLWRLVRNGAKIGQGSGYWSGTRGK